MPGKRKAVSLTHKVRKDKKHRVFLKRCLFKLQFLIVDGVIFIFFVNIFLWEFTSMIVDFEKKILTDHERPGNTLCLNDTPTQPTNLPSSSMNESEDLRSKLTFFFVGYANSLLMSLCGVSPQNAITHNMGFLWSNT